MKIYLSYKLEWNGQGDQKKQIPNIRFYQKM